ncbi:MAG: hypothetical protein ACE5K2_05905, partial [Candidatus Zixiibacteriota bacterium]
MGSEGGRFEDEEERFGLPGPGYKIKIDEDGVYKLDYALLQEAGVNVADIDPRTMKLYNQGREIPIVL